MKTHTQISLVIAMLCIGHFAIAQKVIPVKLEIAKEIPGEAFPNKAFKLEFWIQDQNKFIALDTTNTKILVFEDDLGTNILEAHEKVIYNKKIQAEKEGYFDNQIKNKSIIDFENSRDITGAIGFKLLISSEVLPAENAKELHLKGTITYFAENESGPEQSTVIKDFTPDNEIANWQGKSISIFKNGSSSSDENNEIRIGYSLKNSDINVAVKEIYVVDNSGNTIKSLGYIYMEEGHLNFDISEKEISSPINLKFTYTTLKSVSLPIDKHITMGL
jgi:hypothetical protein